MPGKTTHGLTRTPEYRAWHSMRQRCMNPNNQRFANYGGRGITICPRWDSFQAFLSDMGARPSPDHSIDRIDNDGHYGPGNCRWATRSQQQRNKSKYTDASKLPRGDTHWTRKDPERAIAVARRNITATHRRGPDNNNAKLTQGAADAMRQIYADDPSLKMADLGSMFGVGRETARKIIRGTAW